MDAGLLRHLRAEWKQPLQQLDALLSGPRKVKPAERNRVIGDLRKGLARAVVLALKPGLIVLDEFQRFREVILRPKDPRGTHLLSDWFFGGDCPPVLLLSATPYRLYATGADDGGDEAHLKELMEVLEFVAGAAPGDDRLRGLQEWLGQFRKRMEALPPGETRDVELLGLKHKIEERLKQWMCRTERNWYYADERKGTEEVSVEALDEQWPTEAEALELRRLAGLLGEVGESGAQAIEYWKSAPACLAFMFEQYQVQRRLRAARSPSIRRMERRLAPPAREVPKLLQRNLKLRNLAKRVFPSGTPAGWKYLWCAPTYRYWHDGLFGNASPGDEPSKFLVFSHWRFVPGAVAMLMSDAVERATGCSGRAAWARSEPLRFRPDRSLGLFDACFPSPGLAAAVDPAAIAIDLCGRRPRRPVTRRDIETAAAAQLTHILKEAGFEVASARTRGAVTSVTSLWRVIACLDRQHAEASTSGGARSSWLHQALLNHRPRQARGAAPAQLERKYLADYARWVDEAESRPGERAVITRRQFDRLLRIALHSPAVCLVRAVERAVPGASLHEWFGAALHAGLTGVRHFFNRPYTRQIVDRTTPRARGYVDRVLIYCALGQVQAVLDEYAYLLAEQETSVDRKAGDVARGVVEAMSRVLGLGTGAPRMRVRGSRKPMVGRSHFALAFAEETSEGSGRSRRRSTREAFNSPFWPFVLATTSVGQEGLDFHWYCRDVVHWNLPSNPVDLEQREGRVNRRNSLVVRRSIARDVPLHAVKYDSGREALWTGVFRTVTDRMSGAHHERHGLFPHWLYEGVGRARETEQIRRHVFSYWASRDREKYDRLKQDLALYRLAFGQVNQADLLARLRERARGDGVGRGLEAYMLNLAPFPKGAAWAAARREARERVVAADRAWIQRLVTDSTRLLRQYEDALGPKASEAGRCLCTFLSQWLSSPDRGRKTAEVTRATAALTYLRNPYDDRFDVHRLVGFEDDARRLIEVAAHVGSLLPSRVSVSRSPLTETPP
jgi:hypothetical protein